MSRSTAAAALARRDLGALPVRTRQLLYVLLARRCRPDAGAEEQLSAFARDAGGWPIDLNDDDDFYDVVAGGESVAVPFYRRTPDGAEQPLPAPFLFIRESVPFDESPRWQKSAMHKGCSCQPQRNKLWCVASSSQRAGCCSKDNGRSECGFGCGCAAQPMMCDGRATQRGLRQELELFYYGESKGYGVRAAQWIRKGSFVIEYVGEYISSEEAERRVRLCPRNDDYLFTSPGSSVIIDAYAVRNLAAFMNFSCQPNLEARPVKAEHGDSRMQKVAFFAKEDIDKGTELTYRRDPSASLKASRARGRKCECGAEKCVGLW